MEQLSAAQLAQFRNRLEEEKAGALLELENLKQGLTDPLGTSVQELAVYDNHPGDVGSETYEREKDLGMTDNPRFVLRQIDEALTRLAEGRYGICVDCGGFIGMERLEAVPWADRCLPCQDQWEREGRQAAGFRRRPGRPPEEEVISADWGHLQGLRRQGVGYDAEDTWEDVARYGTSQGPQDDPGRPDYETTREHPPGKPRRRGERPR